MDGDAQLFVGEPIEKGAGGTRLSSLDLSQEVDEVRSVEVGHSSGAVAGFFESLEREANVIDAASGTTRGCTGRCTTGAAAAVRSNLGRIRCSTAVLAALLASGCESPVANERFAATFVTQGNTFAMVSASGGNVGAVETEIPYSYRNDSRGPIYVFLGCQAAPPTLEKQVGDSWEFAWRNPTINDCEMSPIVLAPDQSLDETIHLVAFPFGGDLHPQLAFEEIEGTYRLRWEEDAVVVSYDEEEADPKGRPIDLDSRVSNEFTLTVP